MITFMKYPAALLALLCVGGCATYVVPTPQIYDPVTGVQEYTQRADTVTLSAGDAQDVNTRVQEIDPWPRYVGNKRIDADGQRMAGAVERYRDVTKQGQGPKPLPLVSSTQGASGGGAGAGAGAGGQ
jgi:hypothetical protein